MKYTIYVLSVLMDDILKYLLTGTRGARARVRILQALDRQPRTIAELSRDLDLRRPIVRHHLAVLMANDIVRMVGGNDESTYQPSERANRRWDVIRELADEIE